MFASEMAKYQIQDRVREADAFRAAGATRAARAGQRQGKVRKVLAAAATGLLWPIKR